MFLNIYMPVIEMIGNYFVRTLLRVWDKRFGCSADHTKKRTIIAYIQLYAGPVYAIHYKYSSILNIMFVTLLYGPGMPDLFPLAFFSLMILYIVEKGMLYYGYREPPQYSEMLNNSVLGIMMYAPLFLLASSYWMLSNKQLLSNDALIPLVNQDINYDPAHYWYDSLKLGGLVENWNPATPLLIFFV
jgi:hypothetical protein